MKTKIAVVAVSASAIIYASTVLGYSAALRASSERSALLERARVDAGTIEGSARLEGLERKLARKLRQMTLVTDSRTFERLLQCIASVARRSHVKITGLVPDKSEARDARSPFRGRGLAIRFRGTFADALTFVRFLPAAGVLLSIRDVAFTAHADSNASGALDATLHTALLRPADDRAQVGSK